MPRKTRREEPSYGTEHIDPPYVPNVKRPGDEGSAFRRAPLAEPKAQRQLLALLGNNAGVVLMYGLLAVVVVIVLVLLVVKR
jgi:hypothetical protein